MAGGLPQFVTDGRLIPRSWVVDDNGTAAKAKFTEMLMAYKPPSHIYQLGGHVNSIGADETAINPAMRTAQWSIVSADSSSFLQDIPGSGTCFNHVGSDARTPHSLWGSNMQRLQQIKQNYDPANRFNCYQGIGYEDPGEDDLSSCPLQTTTCGEIKNAYKANSCCRNPAKSFVFPAAHST